jgi:hypothetical protein
MHGGTIILPWSSKKQVTNCHWHHITLDGVFILANFEGDGRHLLNLVASGVAQPLNMIWIGVLLVWEVEFVAKLRARKVMAASTINNDLD